MSTEQPQAQAAAFTVTLDTYGLKLVHDFRERYQQWQACQEVDESLALGKQVDHLQMRLAFYLESAVEKAEAEAAKA